MGKRDGNNGSDDGFEYEMRQMWRAKLIRLLMDARGNGCTPLERHQALEFFKAFRDEESELAFVCEMVGLDFRTIKNRFDYLIKNPTIKINFLVLGNWQNELTEEDRKRFLWRKKREEKIKSGGSDKPRRPQKPKK